MKLTRPDAGDLRVAPLDLNRDSGARALGLKAGDLPLYPRTISDLFEEASDPHAVPTAVYSASSCVSCSR